MKKGGYQIIDLEDREFKIGVGQVFEGIYDRIDGNRKSILISGLNVNGIEKRDCYTYPKIVGTSYVCNIGEYRINITDRDIVTVYFNEVELRVLYNSYDDTYKLADSTEELVDIYKSQPECAIVDIEGVLKSKMFNINTYERDTLTIECHTYQFGGGVNPAHIAVMLINIHPDGTYSIDTSDI